MVDIHKFTKIVFGSFPVALKVKDSYRHQSRLLFLLVSFLIFHFSSSLAPTKRVRTERGL